MIAPEVQAALQMVLSENAGENANGTKVVQAFPEKNKTLILDLLKQEAERHPDRKQAAAGLHRLAVNKVAGAAARLIDAAKVIPASKLLPTVPNNIAELAKSERSSGATESQRLVAREGKDGWRRPTLCNDRPFNSLLRKRSRGMDS